MWWQYCMAFTPFFRAFRYAIRGTDVSVFLFICAFSIGRYALVPFDLRLSVCVSLCLHTLLLCKMWANLHFIGVDVCMYSNVLTRSRWIGLIVRFLLTVVLVSQQLLVKAHKRMLCAKDQDANQAETNCSWINFTKYLPHTHTHTHTVTCDSLIRDMNTLYAYKYV